MCPPAEADKPGTSSLQKRLREVVDGPHRAHPEKKLKDWIVFFAPAYFAIVATAVAYAAGALDMYITAAWLVYGSVLLVLALFIQESRPESFSYLSRNIYHWAGGVLIVAIGLYHLLPFTYIVTFVAILFVMFFSGLAVEMLGIETIFSKSHILKHTPTFTKSSHYEAGTLGLFSCLIVLTLFDALTAYAAILMLAFGDSTASFVGRAVGRTPNPLNPKKTVEGTLAFFAVAMFVTMPILPTSTAFFTALVVSIIEALPLKINDNLVLPISAAVAIRLLSML